MIAVARRSVAALVFLAALMLGALPAAAQYTVRSYVQPQRGITDTTPIQLVVQIEGSGSPQVTPPRLPELDNLKVLGGPSTNTSVVWSNGRSTASYQLIWTLLAGAPGKARIPGLSVTVDGRAYATEPIELEVAKSQAGVQVPREPRKEPQDQASRAADVFIRAELGTREAWVGQPVSLEVTLYTAAQISGVNYASEPDFANFWVESMAVNSDDEAYRTRVDGRIYTAYPLTRKVLIPPAPGNFEIDPYVAQMLVHPQRADLFDFFSRNRAQTIVRKTEPLSLKVKPLPSGAPADFSGAVGRFEASAELDRTQAQVNDAISLRLTVQGEGSLRSIDAPPLAAPPELKVYEPQLAESTTSSRGRLTSMKTWEWILVPLVPGEVRLPEIRFPYFDPTTGQYEVARAGGQLIAVQRGSGTDQPPVAGGGVTLEQRDLAYIKLLRGPLRTASGRLQQRPVFVAAVTLPIVLVPFFVLAGRRRARLQLDRGLVRSRRARTRARKRLHSARGHLRSVDSGEFHEEVARALVEYVADRFDRSATGLTYDVADELLGSRGVEPELRRRYRTCLESCDFARFVPAASKTERREEVLGVAEKLIEELEAAL